MSLVSRAMNLGVLGVGLVSPLALSAEQHVFVLRAGEPMPPASPFLSRTDERLPVRWCPVIGAGAPVGSRCVALGAMALDEALAPLGPLAHRLPLYLVSSEDRPGFSEAPRAEIEAALARRAKSLDVTRRLGAAGAAHALIDAARRIDSGEVRGAVIVAVDSYVDLQAIEAFALRPPNPWQAELTSFAEAAAAVVVGSASFHGNGSRDGGRAPSFAELRAAAVATGTSNDDNDEPVDGTAMSEALRALPGGPPIAAAFGQFSVDTLRTREWSFALARNAARFDAEHELGCLEDHVGRIGAAAGLAALVYGLASLRHQAGRAMRSPGAPLVAWAISRDGARGLALATMGQA